MGICKCIMCDKEYERNDKVLKGTRKGNYKRKTNSVTCSKKCALAYGHLNTLQKKKLKEKRQNETKRI